MPAAHLPAPGTADLHGLFRSEVDRAVDARGGIKAVREQNEALGQERRSERHGGFQRYADGRAQSRAQAGSEATEDPGPAEAPVGGPSRPTSHQPESGAVREPGHAETGSPETGNDRSTASSGSQAGHTPISGAEPTAAPAPIAGAPVGLAPAPGTALPAEPGSHSGPSTEAAREAPLLASKVTQARTTHGAAAAAAPDLERAQHVAEVLQQIRTALAPGRRQVMIELSPNELGRVSIKMQMNDGKLSAVVRAESPQTLEMLERHLPELRAALEQGGIEAESFEMHLGFGGKDARTQRDADAAPAGAAPAEPQDHSSSPGPGASAPVTDPDGIDTYA